jgi:hypothetical protein
MRDTPQTALIAAAVLAVGLTLPATATASPSIEYQIIVGAIDDPANTEYVEDASDGATPLLPIVYDDDSQTNSQTGARGAS